MMPPKLRLRGAASLSLALAMAACGHASPPVANGHGTRSAPRSIRTAVVERDGGAGTVAVPATVAARQRAALAARISASVVELPWREGARVAAGAVVARLDDRALRAGLLAAEAAEAAASVDLARLEALLTRGAATPREAEEGRARAAATNAAVAAARDSLTYAVLRAPFAGTVASRPASVGDVVTPGATLIEIEGSTGLELRATVSDALLSALHPGLSLEAWVDGQPEAVKAILRVVSPSGDSATHRFELRADLPATPDLRSGVFARLMIPAPRGAPRLLVPSSAVFQRGGLHGLFVVAEHAARLRWVAVGASEGAAVEIRAGVVAGERVALEPDQLVDGAAVSEAAPEVP
jgi:membrane fusion protein, multidrug efflux system